MIKPSSFLIFTPCDDGHKFCFWQSIRAFENAYRDGTLNTPHHFDVIQIPGDSLVPRARNNFAEQFLSMTGAEYLLSLDSDLDFRPDDLVTMADLAVRFDLSILCGLYAIKQDEMRWCINSIMGKEVDKTTGLQEISMAPGGFNLVHRRVFNAMRAAAPEWPHWAVQYNEDESLKLMHNYYYNGVVVDEQEWPDKPLGRYLSEDWGFSYFARKLGFKIFAHVRTVALHRGECFYPRQARRLTREETEAQAIKQADGSTTAITKA